MDQTITDSLHQCKAGLAVHGALQDLLLHDLYLLQADANERSISFRLAMHLQARLPYLHVDCEYIRDGIDPKKIQHLGLAPNDDDTEAKTVFPDIIAHVRGTHENVLVVEMKKSSNATDRAKDYAKLRGYKANLGFKHALFLEVVTGMEASVSVAEWI